MTDLQVVTNEILTEYKDELVKMGIQSRLDNGRGALFININKSNSQELDIEYYKEETLPDKVKDLINKNKNIKNTIYFVFLLNDDSLVLEHELNK